MKDGKVKILLKTGGNSDPKNVLTSISVLSDVIPKEKYFRFSQINFLARSAAKIIENINNGVTIVRGGFRE